MQTPDPPSPAPSAARAPYVPPLLEDLGGWTALTLQQSFVVADEQPWTQYLKNDQK
ncbi:MAG TPA: hypothetical protein VF584_11755 [Longimicrobium sp.]|jgi:hypothetical protein